MVLTRDQVSVPDDDQVLEADGGDGSATLWVCLNPLNWTLEMVKTSFFFLKGTTRAVGDLNFRAAAPQPSWI